MATWKELEQIAPPEVVDALKNLNAFYDGSKIADWMANLYDPEVGGFYYSNSARDTEGFLPDLESTVQLLRWTEANGAFVRPIKEMIPTDMAEKLVKKK